MTPGDLGNYSHRPKCQITNLLTIRLRDMTKNTFLTFRWRTTLTVDLKFIYEKFQNNRIKTVVCRARSGLRTEPQTDRQTHRQREHNGLSARLIIKHGRKYSNKLELCAFALKGEHNVYSLVPNIAVCMYIYILTTMCIFLYSVNIGN